MAYSEKEILETTGVGIIDGEFEQVELEAVMEETATAEMAR